MTQIDLHRLQDTKLIKAGANCNFLGRAGFT